MVFGSFDASPASIAYFFAFARARCVEWSLQTLLIKCGVICIGFNDLNNNDDDDDDNDKITTSFKQVTKLCNLRHILRRFVCNMKTKHFNTEM